jgi:hypothetical protein
MGDWWIEEEMEIVEEKVCIHKTKVHNFVYSCNYIFYIDTEWTSHLKS